MIAVAIIEALALVLLGLLVFGLLRSHGEILRQLDELGAGRDQRREDWRSVPEPIAIGASPEADRDFHARDIHGQLLDGASAAVGVSGASHDTLLAFLSANCSTCEPFWSAFADPRLEVPNHARLVIVVQDHEDPSAIEAMVPRERLVTMSSAAWSDYDVPGSPHFVYVDGPSGRVTGEGTGADWRQVQSLVSQAEGNSRRNRSAVQTAVGDTAESNPERVDRELLAAGIGPGHRSLYQPLD